MSTDDIKMAVGCLSTVFPQFVAKELASFTDQIATALQAVTDPLAALGNIHLDSLVDNAAALSEGDIMGNVASAAAGFAFQYTKRELEEQLSAMSADNPSAAKRVQQIRNLASKGQMMVGVELSLIADMPYLVAQRMCKTIIELDELKIKNLQCLRKHIAQLVNSILVLVKNGAPAADRTFADLAKAHAFLVDAKTNLARSQTSLGGRTHFDAQSFGRARTDVANASSALTPDKDGTSILDVLDILNAGSVSAGQLSRANERLAILVLPGLINLIEAEVGAVLSQVRVINYHIEYLGKLIDSFRRVGQTSQIQLQRARLIRDIQARLDDLVGRIEAAIQRKSLRAASAEMLLWASRLKSILATMDTVKDLSLKEGSLEGPDKALLLEQAFQQLLTNLTSLSTSSEFSAGIENPMFLRDGVLGLTKGARRLLKDLESGRATPSHLATFHAQALAVATGQSNRIEASSSFASQQKTACERFASIDLAYAPRLEGLIDSLRQLGLDRGVDLLSTGRFDELNSLSPNLLSYLGTAAECIKHAIDASDDVQTRQQLSRIRTDLIAKRANQEIAAADSADNGLIGTIGKVKSQIAAIQTSAKTVESIVSDLKQALKAVGEGFDDTFEGLKQFNAFLGNLDHLAVAAGGRLAAGLEEFSEHPNAGVVACELP